MTATRAASSSAALVALSLVIVTVGVWRWRSSVFRSPRLETVSESWDQLKHAYPIPSGAQAIPALSSETVDVVLHANPFSPQRRAVATDVENPQQGTGAVTASMISGPPQFIYKGQINLGKKQRAVIEETTAKKTYFLELGQEVAGFKVLDIKEKQVILSDPQTNKEVVVSLASKELPNSQ